MLSLYVDVKGLSITEVINTADADADVVLVGGSGLSAARGGVDLNSNPLLQMANCGFLHDGINVLTAPYATNGGNIVPLYLFFQAEDNCEAQYNQGLVGSCF